MRSCPGHCVPMGAAVGLSEVYSRLPSCARAISLSQGSQRPSERSSRTMFSPQGSYLPSPPAYHDSLPSSSPRSPRGPLPHLSLAGTGTGASTPRTPDDMPNALDLEGDDGSPLLPAPAQMAREQGREERVEFEYRPIFIPRTDMSGLGEANAPGGMGGMGVGGAAAGYGTRDTRGGSLLRPYISRDENGAVREKEAEQGLDGRKISPWIIGGSSLPCGTMRG